MVENKTNNNEKDTSWLLIVYQIGIYISMMSGYRGVAYYIAIAFTGLFFSKIFIKHKGRIPADRSVKSFVLFLLFYWVMATMNFRNRTFYVDVAYYVLCFFPILIKEYLRINTSTKMIIRSLKCFVVILIGYSIVAIVYYLENPGMARDMASHSIDTALAIGGGYSLAYAAAVLCVYFFSKMINNRIKKKGTYIFICIVCIYLVYLTESSLTMISMVIGIVISIATRGREISKGSGNDLLKFSYLGILAGIGVIFVYYNRYSVAEFVLDFVRDKDHNIVYSRIEEIVNKFVYGKTNYHVNRRDNTLEQSWNIFKEYPLFGMGYKYGFDFNLGKEAGMGNHSEILDSFARYGLIGGILWLTPYFMTIKQIIRTNFGCAMTILIMMFFNPFLSFHSNAVMFMFIPLFEEVLKRREENRIHQ